MHAVELSRLERDALRHEQPQDRPRLLDLRAEQAAPIIEFDIQITLELAPVESDIADAAQACELIGERRIHHERHPGCELRPALLFLPVYEQHESDPTRDE